MAAGPPGSVNALLDGEAQHSACGARFGLPASPYRSLNHGSFGQPCERAREVAAAFRAEMDTQPDLWFRERYSAHLKNATAQLEAYLHIPLSCRRLVAGEDNPEYTAGTPPATRPAAASSALILRYIITISKIRLLTDF